MRNKAAFRRCLSKLGETEVENKRLTFASCLLRYLFPIDR